jgi:predicted DNA-binding transcriptional regulator YafY
VENDDFDTEEYFGDIIGVTKEKEAEVVKIVLRFSEHRFPYVQRKPMHESQTDYRKEERIIELKLSPNKEFYQKLLSYGEDVEVVEPKEVRKVMMEKVEEMYKLYQK